MCRSRIFSFPGLALLLAVSLAGCAPAATPTATVAPKAAASPAVATPAPTKPAAPSPAPTKPAAPSPSPTPAAVATPLPTKPAATPSPATKQAAGTSAEITFQWQTNLSTPEDADPIVTDLKQTPGILDGVGSETSITIRYDPQRITPDEIARRLGDMGHPVKR